MKQSDVNALNEKYLEIFFESFKDYKSKKSSEGYDVERIKRTIEEFRKERQRIEPPENDIGFWMRKPLEELESKLNNLPKSKNKLKKHDINTDEIKENDNLQLLYEDDRWVVVYVKNFQGSRELCGMTTDWCVTKSEAHWNQYTDVGYFVYAFDKDKEPYNIHTKEGDPQSKLAIRINYEQDDILDIHDAPDEEISNELEFNKENYPFYDMLFSDEIDIERITGEDFENIMIKTDAASMDYYSVEMNDDFDDEFISFRFSFSFGINIYEFEHSSGEIQAYLMKLVDAGEDSEKLKDILDWVNDDFHFSYSGIYTNDKINFQIYGDIEEQDDYYVRTYTALVSFEQTCNYYKQYDKDTNDEQIKHELTDYFIEIGVMDEEYDPDKPKAVPDDPRQMKFDFMEKRYKSDNDLIMERYIQSIK